MSLSVVNFWKKFVTSCEPVVLILSVTSFDVCRSFWQFCTCFWSTLWAYWREKYWFEEASSHNCNCWWKCVRFHSFPVFWTIYHNLNHASCGSLKTVDRWLFAYCRSVWIFCCLCWFLFAECSWNFAVFLSVPHILSKPISFV